MATAKSSSATRDLLVAIGVQLLVLIRLAYDMFLDLIFSLIYKGGGDRIQPIRDNVLLESANRLAYKIRTRKIRSEEVVKAFITRIREVNPVLNAVVDQRFDGALEEARAIDRFISSGQYTERELEVQKPFLGVPFTVKDSLRVKGMRQTLGLPERRNAVAEDDAVVVKLMREAGAIPLAVTNVSELCMWWETSNNLYGTTNNPYDTTRTVGGSSGGEASITAAAGSVIGLASDIGGSIRIPAFMTGIFGHKPTTGVVPNQGQEPLITGEQQYYLSTGFVCRFASDLLPVLKILAKPNLHQLQLDQTVDMKSLNVYYMEDDGGNPITSAVHPDLKTALRNVVFHLESTFGIKTKKIQIQPLIHSFAIWSVKMGTAASPHFSEHMAQRKV